MPHQKMQPSLEIDAFDDFSETVDKLVALNIARRASFGNEIIPAFGNTYWASEFCTVHVDIGRRSGKSRYIGTRATKDAIVIIHLMSLVKHHPAYKAAAGVFTKEQILSGAARDLTFSMVYIDEPGFFDHEELRSIYQSLSGTERTFVLLGK
jgi:hypothetical protein